MPWAFKAKKLAAVSATSTSVTANSEASAQALGTLKRVPCIWYPVQFQKESQLEEVRALIDSGSKVNAMTPAFAARLGFITWATNIGAQKINGSPLETYGIVSARFLLQDSLEEVWFFKETFLLVDTSVEVVLGMPFLSLSNADFQFSAEELTWRSYTATEALPTTRRVKLIDKKEFAKAALDENSETFVVHVAALEASKPAGMLIHLSRAA